MEYKTSTKVLQRHTLILSPEDVIFAILARLKVSPKSFANGDMTTGKEADAITNFPSDHAASSYNLVAMANGNLELQLDRIEPDSDDNDVLELGIIERGEATKDGIPGHITVKKSGC